jgi:hypothetical protein
MTLVDPGFKMAGPTAVDRKYPERAMGAPWAVQHRAAHPARFFATS